MPIYTISSGQMSSGIDLPNAYITVSSGGAVVGAIVTSGTLQVLGGAVADGTTLLQGGSAFVYPAGAASGLVIGSGGFAMVSSGGSVLGGAVNSGGTLVLLPQAAVSGLAGSGGRIISGGVVTVLSNTLISAAMTTTGALLSSSEIEFVYNGGLSVSSLLGSTTQPFGSFYENIQNVDIGGTAVGAVLNLYGFQTISSGGAASFTAISQGGQEIVSGGGHAVSSVVFAGGYIFVGAGGSTTGTVLRGPVSGMPGGFEAVQSGGVTSNTLALSGGQVQVQAGGVASGLVDSGGIVMMANGTLIDAVVDSGGQINSFGTLSGTVINSGGTVDMVDGTLVSTTVNSGGLLYVIGTPVDTMVMSGGILAFRVPYFTYPNPIATLDPSTHVLTVAGGTYSQTLQLGAAEAYTGAITAGLNMDETGATVFVTFGCFAAGTGIATAEGPAAVETLRAGDLVLTASGAVRPLIWVGHRTIRPAEHPSPALIWPIRIRAGALAEGVPSADLLLSPDHALLIDGLLVPAHALVNGDSILQEQVAEVSYWHLELETHDILLAHATPAESYLDTGNRDSFAGALMRLQPDFAGAAAAYAAHGAAPLVTDPSVIRPLWHRFAERAAAIDVTDDPALSLLVGGQRLAPRGGEAGLHMFDLPSGTRFVVLLSRTARPSDRDPWCGDRRVLGVAVAAVRFDGVAVPLDRLSDGWHGLERAEGRCWRWTSGAARIDVPQGGDRLEVQVDGTLLYRSHWHRTAA